MDLADLQRLFVQRNQEAAVNPMLNSQVVFRGHVLAAPKDPCGFVMTFGACSELDVGLRGDLSDWDARVVGKACDDGLVVCACCDGHSEIFCVVDVGAVDSNPVRTLCLAAEAILPFRLFDLCWRFVALDLQQPFWLTSFVLCKEHHVLAVCQTP